MASTNKTTNYSLSQFLAADVPSWISDYTADMQKIEEGMTDNKAGVKSVQPDEYSDASTYSVGDYCIENNTIYKCKTAINSPEEFNPSHWEETTIYKELSALNSSIDDLEKVETLYSPASPISFPGEIDVDITAYRVVCMAVYSGSTASSNRQHVLISTHPGTAQYIPVQLGTTASYIRIEYASGKLSLLSSGAPASVGAIYGIVK